MVMNGLTKSQTKYLYAVQSLTDFGVKRGADGKLVRLDGSRIKHNAAYKDWLYRLKPGERLPRGRYFRNKKPGPPIMMMDEFHCYASILPKGSLDSMR